MRQALGMIALAFVVVSCSPVDDLMGNTNKCVTNLSPCLLRYALNPRPQKPSIIIAQMEGSRTGGNGIVQADCETVTGLP
jgi:hypothetical protein